MTYGEIVLLIETYAKQRKIQRQEALSDIYNTAVLTADFIMTRYAGKQLPSLHEVFPGMDNEVIPKEKNHNGLSECEYNRAMMYKEQMIDFANRRNKRIKEGEIVCK